MKKKGLVLFLLSALLFTACGTEKNKTEETGKLTVVTSFYPVYLLAQEIVQGAEGIRLENMAQPQTGCLHDYELSISDMKLLETADIFIINGGGMESFLEQALERYPELTVVDTSEGIALLEGPRSCGSEGAWCFTSECIILRVSLNIFISSLV